VLKFLAIPLLTIFLLGATNACQPQPSSPNLAPRLIAGEKHAETERIELKVLTYNIERGLQRDSGNNIADLLLKHQPDVICLQEVSWPKKKNLKTVVHQAEYLANALGYNWTCCVRGRLKYENYGMAVLIRGKLQKSRALAIPHEKPYGLLVQVEIDGRKLTVVCIHARPIGSGPRVQAFLATEFIRLEQTNDLLKQLDSTNEPIIVAGDFNTLPQSVSYRVLLNKFQDAARGTNALKFTRLTEGFPARIDYIFVPTDADLLSYNVLPVDYSDHRPVVATVILPPLNKRPELPQKPDNRPRPKAM